MSQDAHHIENDDVEDHDANPKPDPPAAHREGWGLVSHTPQLVTLCHIHRMCAKDSKKQGRRDDRMGQEQYRAAEVKALGIESTMAFATLTTVRFRTPNISNQHKQLCRDLKLEAP